MMQNLAERSGVRCTNERMYGSLDIAKFLMALAVICIHTAPFRGTPLAMGMRNVADIAVPFFFMASGFLCFNKCNCGDIRMNHASASASRVKKTIRGLAVMYVIWSALYLPLTIYGIQLDLVDGFSPVREILLLAFNYSFVGNQYLSWQLWYLLGSVFAFSGVYLLISMGFRWRGILLTSGALALAGFVAQLIVGYGLTEDMGLTGRVLFHYQFLFARNGFCPGLFYVALGGAVAQSTRSQTPVLLRIGLVVSILLIFFISGPLFNPTEAWNVGQICSPPLTATASYCALTLCVHRPDGKPHAFLRCASAVAYLTHMWFVFFLYIAIYGTARNQILELAPSGWQPLVFLSVAGGSFLLSVVVWHIRDSCVVKLAFGI